MSAVSVSQPGVRPILADAVDVAQRALLELEPAGVGAHLGVTAEDDTAATHRFEATLPGYRGWQWAVVVAAPPGAEYATVSESALLPGPEALVAPEFIPWDQRIRPGDLAPGDLLAPRPNDSRLVPGYVDNGDPAVDDVAIEIGLGRPKVLSLEGRAEAAEHWYTEYGPDTDMAKAAPSTCGLCGFYLPIAGALRAAFGVCANGLGADGHVVHTAYGCGAHSDTELPTGGGSPLYEAFDDAAYDVIPAETVRKPKRGEDTESDKSAEVAGDAAAGGDTAAEPNTQGSASCPPAAGDAGTDANAGVWGVSGAGGAAAGTCGVTSASDADVEGSIVSAADADSAGQPSGATADNGSAESSASRDEAGEAGSDERPEFGSSSQS